MSDETVSDMQERAGTKFKSEFTRIEHVMKVLCWKCFKWVPEDKMVDLSEGWTCDNCAPIVNRERDK